MNLVYVYHKSILYGTKILSHPWFYLPSSWTMLSGILFSEQWSAKDGGDCVWLAKIGKCPSLSQRKINWLWRTCASKSSQIQKYKRNGRPICNLQKMKMSLFISLDDSFHLWTSGLVSNGPRRCYRFSHSLCSPLHCHNQNQRPTSKSLWKITNLETQIWIYTGNFKQMIILLLNNNVGNLSKS